MNSSTRPCSCTPAAVLSVARAIAELLLVESHSSALLLHLHDMQSLVEFLASTKLPLL